jgi:hypothetical protein
MHEALITRGDVYGRKDIASRIFVRENCVLVHHSDCHVESNTKIGQKKVMKHVLYWMGADAIYNWLDSLADDFVGTTITEAKNLVSEVTNESKNKLQR